jgi:nicotinate-nucleotide pyrophosphorylase (carboxylating)
LDLGVGGTATDIENGDLSTTFEFNLLDAAASFIFPTPDWTILQSGGQHVEFSIRCVLVLLKLCFRRFFSILCGVNALAAQEIQRAVQLALAEDIGAGDVTTLATVPERLSAKAAVRSREPLVVCGIDFAEAAFLELSDQVKIVRRVEDGQHVDAAKTLLELAGPARALLTAERVALNFLQRLSGIATLTAQFVQAVSLTRAKILDTRKTTPGWRRFEKYAVTCGGGQNHRLGLYDMILIKDNHLAALKGESPNAIAAAVDRARTSYPNLKVEVEADTLEQVDQALAAGVDLLLVDNMNPVQLRLAVQKCKGSTQTEASGGVSLASVRSIAEAGVDFISVGALTHSARAVDIGLDFELQ